MAYEGGGLISLWKPDITTRSGAMSAMASAKFGFLIVGGFRLVMFIIGAGLSSLSGALASEPLVMWMVLAWFVIDIGLPFLAAYRLHLNQGAYVTPLATATFVLSILLSLGIASIVAGVVFTGAFVSGARAAWAVKRGTGFDDDAIDIFA